MLQLITFGRGPECSVCSGKGWIRATVPNPATAHGGYPGSIQATRPSLDGSGRGGYSGVDQSTRTAQDAGGQNGMGVNVA